MKDYKNNNKLKFKVEIKSLVLKIINNKFFFKLNLK